MHGCGSIVFALHVCCPHPNGLNAWLWQYRICLARMLPPPQRSKCMAVAVSYLPCTYVAPTPTSKCMAVAVSYLPCTYVAPTPTSKCMAVAVVYLPSSCVTPTPPVLQLGVGACVANCLRLLQKVMHSRTLIGTDLYQACHLAA